MEVGGPEFYWVGRASMTSQDPELLPGTSTTSWIWTHMEGLYGLETVGRHPRAPNLGSPSSSSLPLEPTTAQLP